MTPRVSVLLPVRNGARYLRESIDSILAQTESDFELIVVDDGSTDDTLDVVSGFHDSRIRIVTQEALGLVAALNHGLDEARASIIVRQDADDLSHPERLERVATFLDANPRAAVVSTWHAPIDESGRPRGAPYATPVRSADLRRTLLIGNPMGAVAARRDVLRDAGGYRAEYLHNEDYDLWRRLVGGHDLAVVPEPLYLVRAHEGSVSSVFEAEQAANRARILDELWRDPSLRKGAGFLSVLAGARAARAHSGALDTFVDLQLALARALRARGHPLLAGRVAAGALVAQPTRLRKLFQRTTLS